MIRSFVCFVLAMGLCRASGADWPQFRGRGGNAVAYTALPLRWNDAENIAWKVDLPGRGPSSPIVVGDRVIVTCSGGRNQTRLHVLCFDTEAGRLVWQRQFWATGRTLTHPTSAVAAPTPASDGNSIFAFFSSNDLVCLDLDGNLKWYRGLAYDYPKAGNDTGMSCSPVVARQTVVVQIENQGDSFACGINTADGRTRWRVPRDHRAGWTSPAVLQAGGRWQDAVLLQSPGGVTVHDLHTGKVLWRLEDEFATIASPLAVGNRVYLPSHGLQAVEFSGRSDAPELVWQASRLRCGGPSPVYHEGRIYGLAGTILSCGDADTGKVLWKLRLPGTHWATPVIAAGYMYCVSRDGDMRVVQLGGKRGEIVAVNRFGEIIQATPAVADGAMYVRSDAHLWRISAR